MTVIGCTCALVVAMLSYWLLQVRPVYLLDFQVYQPPERWVMDGIHRGTVRHSEWARLHSQHLDSASKCAQLQHLGNVHLSVLNCNMLEPHFQCDVTQASEAISCVPKTNTTSDLGSVRNVSLDSCDLWGQLAQVQAMPLTVLCALPCLCVQLGGQRQPLHGWDSRVQGTLGSPATYFRNLSAVSE